jgi:ribose transport system permease protein
VTKFVDRYGSFVALVLLVLIGAIFRPEILNPENLRNLLNQNAFIGIMAVGMTLVITAGGIDLSIGSLMAFCAAVCLHTINRQISGGAAEPVAVAVGALVSLGLGALLGAVNGLLVTVGRIAPFIATLGGLVAYRSFTLVSAEGGEIRSLSQSALTQIARSGLPFPALPDGRPMFTWAVAIFFAMTALGAWMLGRTRFGRHVVAVGSNERAARYSGIETGRVKLACYAFLGLCCGISAFLQVARSNSVSSSGLGQLNELDAIAAVVIGGTSLAGGRGRVWGTVNGLLILGVINLMLNYFSVSNYWHGFVKGAIILLAVLIQRGTSTER